MTCVGEDGRAQNAQARRNMPAWSVRHRKNQDAIFGTCTDVANMYTDYELAEELAHDFELIDADRHLDIQNRSASVFFQVGKFA